MSELENYLNTMKEEIEEQTTITPEGPVEPHPSEHREIQSPENNQITPNKSTIEVTILRLDKKISKATFIKEKFLEDNTRLPRTIAEELQREYEGDKVPIEVLLEIGNKTGSEIHATEITFQFKCTPRQKRQVVRHLKNYHAERRKSLMNYVRTFISSLRKKETPSPQPDLFKSGFIQLYEFFLQVVEMVNKENEKPPKEQMSLLGFFSKWNELLQPLIQDKVISEAVNLWRSVQ